MSSQFRKGMRIMIYKVFLFVMITPVLIIAVGG